MNITLLKRGYKMEPLIIQIGRQRDGCTYQLHPSSRVQLKKTFPKARPVPSVFIGYDTQSDFEVLHGPLWKQVATMLTGLSWKRIENLGGIKIYDPVQETAVEQVL